MRDGRITGEVRDGSAFARIAADGLVRLRSSCWPRAGSATSCGWSRRRGGWRWWPRRARRPRSPRRSRISAVGAAGAGCGAAHRRARALGAARRRPRARAGRVHGAHGSERLGQDDALDLVAGLERPVAGSVRVARRRAGRAVAGRARGAAPAATWRWCRRARRSATTSPSARTPSWASSPAAGRGRGRSRSWPRSASRGWWTGRRASSQAGSASASRSPVRWRSTPTCSSRTSRPPTSTSAAPVASRGSSRRRRRGGDDRAVRHARSRGGHGGRRGGRRRGPLGRAGQRRRPARQRRRRPISAGFCARGSALMA